MKHYRHYLYLLLLFAACHQPTQLSKSTSKPVILESNWRAQLNLGVKILPFNFILSLENEHYYATIINAEEKIKSEAIRLFSDSISVRLPIFNSEFRAQVVNDSRIEGYWYNYDKCCDYKIPFSADANQTFRFTEQTSTNEQVNFNGKWEVTFSPNSSNEYKAIGSFVQNNNTIRGTFMTETGDYRYLDGNVFGNRLYLSCFDGSHAFLFEAEYKDSVLNGMFYSGSHWKESWVGQKNASFELQNPDSLTYLKDGYDQLTFTFPDLNGIQTSFPTEKTEDKVTIIQIMGSWCPNCMDETRFLVDMYKRYHQRGLEIYSICFERSPSFEEAAKNVKRHQIHLGADWTFLISGFNGKDKASKALPMLSQIISFPTAVFIDRKGVIRKIHTGFYGPGTGSYYDRFYETTNAFINRLLVE